MRRLRDPLRAPDGDQTKWAAGSAKDAEADEDEEPSLGSGATGRWSSQAQWAIGGSGDREDENEDGGNIEDEGQGRRMIMSPRSERPKRSSKTPLGSPRLGCHLPDCDLEQDVSDEPELLNEDDADADAEARERMLGFSSERLH